MWRGWEQGLLWAPCADHARAGPGARLWARPSGGAWPSERCHQITAPPARAISHAGGSPTHTLSTHARTGTLTFLPAARSQTRGLTCTRGRTPDTPSRALTRPHTQVYAHTGTHTRADSSQAFSPAHSHKHARGFTPRFTDTCVPSILIRTGAHTPAFTCRLSHTRRIHTHLRLTHVHVLEGIVRTHVHTHRRPRVPFAHQ